MNNRISARPTWILMILLLAVAIPAGLAGAQGDAWQIETVDQDGNSNPSLALDGAGRPRIAYGAHGDLKYAWHDGIDWHDEVVETQPGSTGWYPSLALDGDDEPHISYYSPYSTSLMYAAYYSATWHIQTVGDPYTGGGQTALALDASARPHVAYWDYDYLTVWYTYYDGADWQFDIVATMATGGQNVSLDLALDTAGHPHLCYYDYEVGNLIYTHYDGADWQFDTVDDDVFYNGQDCAIALDSGDGVHISYRDLGLLYARRDGGGWQTTIVDDDFFAGSDSSLALDAQDHPHISYTDWAVPDQELRYAYFGGQSWWVERVDTAAETGRFEDSSLAVDAAGLPHVGYWDLSGDNALKYATRDSLPDFYRVYLPLVLRER